MNGDAAEEVVKMTLNGVDVAIRLVGAGAKELAGLLVTWVKKEKKHVGKTSLPKLLTSGDELHVLSLTKEQYEGFRRQAKKKITYAPFLNTKSKDGKVDIVLGAKQLHFANYILNRIGYGNIEPGTGARAEILDDREKEALGMRSDSPSGDSKKNDTPSKGGSSGSREPSPRRSLGREEVKASVEKKLQENKRLLERQQKQQPLSRKKNRSKPKPSRDATSR